MDWERTFGLVNLPRERLAAIGSLCSKLGLVVGFAYVGASSLSAWLASSLLGSALTTYGKVGRQEAKPANVNFSPSINYNPIEKSIKNRNLFNSTGEFPQENADKSKPQEETKTNFDINAACNKSTAEVDLLGTIFMDGPGSLATLQEKGYGEADIYREGDLIIGVSGAIVARIERNRVILNHNGKKECLELASENPKKKDDGFPAGQAGGSAASKEAPPEGTVRSDCAFDEKYVQDELGVGFGTIIQKARLVPNTTDNVMNGFKIFAIDPGSLLGKTGLQNNDVITQVNDTSLKQPEQGFSLYQAFQDEKEVRIHILRNGTTPMTIVCRIK